MNQKPITNPPIEILFPISMGLQAGFWYWYWYWFCSLFYSWVRHIQFGWLLVFSTCIWEMGWSFPFLKLTWDAISYRHVTFLCGRGGVYALGAVVANYLGDHQRLDFYLNLFLEVIYSILALTTYSRVQNSKICSYLICQNKKVSVWKIYCLRQGWANIMKFFVIYLIHSLQLCTVRKCYILVLLLLFLILVFGCWDAMICL